MDWSRAKTIFIITFLLLNLFLGYQLNEKRSASNISLRIEATLQERLSEMNITIANELQDEQLTGTYISGSPKLDLEQSIIKEKTSHKIFDAHNEIVVALFQKPISLVDDGRTLKVLANEFVSEHIVNGSDYRFSHYDEELQRLYFYQAFEGKKVDNYEGGRFPLVLQLNDEEEIFMYEQSYLTLQPIQPTEDEVIASIKAIEKLFNAQLIPQDSEIKLIELSYFSFFRPAGEVQVFAPMWNIGVNDQIYYVNAIDGAIQNIQ